MNISLMSYMKSAPKNFSRVFKFTMNDELVHTGFDKLGGFFLNMYFIIIKNFIMNLVKIFLN